MSQQYQKYQEQQKKKVIGMLKALLRKIESEEFLVVSHGFWLTKLDEKIRFSVDVVVGDSQEEIQKLGKFS